MPHKHSFPKRRTPFSKVADDFELNNLTPADTFPKCDSQKKYAMDDNVLVGDITRKVLRQDADKIDFLQGEIKRLTAVSEAAVAKATEERQFIQYILNELNTYASDPDGEIDPIRLSVHNHLYQRGLPPSPLPRKLHLYSIQEPIWKAGHQCTSPISDEDGIHSLVEAARHDPEVRRRNDELDPGELAPQRRREFLAGMDDFWDTERDEMVDWLDHAPVVPATGRQAQGGAGVGTNTVLSDVEGATGQSGAAVGTNSTTTITGTEQHPSDQGASDANAGPANAPPPPPPPPPAVVAPPLPSAPAPAPAPKSRKRKATGPPVATREQRPRAAKSKKLDYKV